MRYGPVLLRRLSWASYQIRKISTWDSMHRCHMHRECRERFPRHRFQGTPLGSDPGMHHGACIVHVPWWMYGSLTCGDGEDVPGIPGACATHNFRYLARGPLSGCEAGISPECLLWLTHAFQVDFTDSCIPSGLHRRWTIIRLPRTSEVT